MSKNTSPRKGRPKGSKNTEQPVIAQELPRCCACGGTDLKVLRKWTREHHGQRDGQPYTAIIRRRVQCPACGKVQILRGYAFDPNRWRGTKPKNE